MVSEAILGEEYISQEAVEQTGEMLEVSKIEDQIHGLPQQPLAVLKAAYRLRGKKELSTGDVYLAYERERKSL